MQLYANEVKRKNKYILHISEKNFKNTVEEQEIMRLCEFNTGETTKQLCGTENKGFCVNCGKAVCDKHAMATSSGIFCLNCAASATQSADMTPIVEYPEQEDSFWDQIS